MTTATEMVGPVQGDNAETGADIAPLSSSLDQVRAFIRAS